MSDSPFAPILGRVPSGIYILTLKHGEEETGMLASWVMQAGFEPPMLTVAVRKGRYVGEWLDAGEPFALNVLAEDQKAMLGHFGRGFDLGQPAFEGLSLERSERGVPVLADALGYLQCVATSHVDSGDHRIYLATIDDGRLSDERRPMVHIRKNGLNY